MKIKSISFVLPQNVKQVSLTLVKLVTMKHQNNLFKTLTDF